MIFLDKKSAGKIEKHLSVVDREKLATSISTPKFMRNVNIVNTAINIAVPLGIFALTGFNVIALGVGFVATDVVLNVLGDWVYVKHPQAALKRMTLEKAENKLGKIEAEKEALDKRIADLRVKYCEDCTDYSYSRRSCTSCKLMYKLVTRRSNMKELIDNVKSYIKNENWEVQEVIEETKKKALPIDYTNIAEVKKRLSGKGYAFLTPVLNSLDELMRLLDEKPVGAQFIPHSLYIYFEELQGLVDNYANMNNAHKEEYRSTIEEISKKLSDCVNKINKRIDEFEVGDFEVNAKVLLQELERLSKSDLYTDTPLIISMDKEGDSDVQG